MFSIIVILEETLLPPSIAVTGFSEFFNTLLMLSISFANKAPKHLSFGNSFAIIVVEACALCAVPKASFTYTSPKLANSLEKPTSPASSSA